MSFVHLPGRRFRPAPSALCAVALAAASLGPATASPAHAVTSGLREFTQTATFTVPADVTGLQIEAWGAAGGGQGTFTSPEFSGLQSGGGGGAGGYVRGAITVVPLETLTVTIGTGGTGGPGNSTPTGSAGGNGGTTTVTRGTTALLTAQGGNGASGDVFHNGGAGGSGTAPAPTALGGGGLVRPGQDGSSSSPGEGGPGVGGTPYNVGTVNPRDLAKGGDGSGGCEACNSTPGTDGYLLMTWS